MNAAHVQTFHTQIAANRRRSLLLVLFVAGLLAVFGFVVGFALSGAPEGGYVATVIALVIALLMTGVSYFAGDSVVLAASRARPLEPEGAPQLFNVVRELTIAANIPPPKIYLIDDTAPNAFATGRSPNKASIALTTGLLDKLDREELQGVIAHELAHVRNLDIRFALLVGVLVGSIALLADFFLRVTLHGGIRTGSRSGRGRDGAALLIILFILALVLAVLAPFIARLVQMAVSRQREYLADASSVELTRNPYGLERALAKIGTDSEVLEVANRATQHLYFVNPIKKFEARASGLMSTHPPIVDRINRLRALTGSAPVDVRTMAALVGLD